MQWLIDIAVEAMQEWIYANGIYRSRGDYAGSDWDHTTMTLDNSWRDADCSGIIDEHAKAVVMRLKMEATVAEHMLRFRQKGMTISSNTELIRSQVANIIIASVITVGVDADRVFQYRAQAANWTSISLIVLGWIM